MATTLKPGDTAPDFTLPDAEGRAVHLRDQFAAGPVVVYFYPKDETLVCTAQACSFRDQYEDFRAAGATVIGISRDPPASHRAFAAHHKLPFLLLSDVDGTVAAQFGVARLAGFLDGRVTFVLDQQGIVRHAFSARLLAARHVDDALRIVRQLGQA